MEEKIIWQNFIERIKSEIDPMYYDTWFSELKLYSINNDKIQILVPMEIYKKTLTNNYNDLIEKIFESLLNKNIVIEYITEDETSSEQHTTITHSTKKQTFESNLIKKYKFDNFIRGESNKFARDNAMLIAENPGKLYNPFFIYGNSGLGKTHLMHAIGNYIDENTNLNVLYATSDRFVNDFLSIYRDNKENNNLDIIDNFKRKYSNVDVLIIDDIQYFEIAIKTQQAFFNTFNELHSNNKQIIISSDRSPEDLKKLEVRLRTRFTSGLAVDILPPDFELRLNIIDRKIQENEMKSTFPQDVKDYIASNCTSDVRKIEGAITRIYAYAAIMNGSNITLELAQEALKDFFVKSEQSKNKIDQVISLVANAYNITIDDLKGKKRNAQIVYPRQVAMYICRDFLNESFARIGLEFGGKDHTTVMHAIDKIKIEITKTSDLDVMIKEIIPKIK